MEKVEVEPARRVRSIGAMHRLTDRQCRSATATWTSDGGGLVLRRTGDKRAFYFRWTADARTRYINLGDYPDRSLAEAREKAREFRNWIADGLDPTVELKRRADEQVRATQSAARQAELDALTLERAVRNYHRAHKHEWTAKHGAQWLRQIELHIFPTLGGRQLASIRPAELLDVLRPLKARLPETGGRIRERLDAVFADAQVQELCVGNPAAAILRALRGRSKRVVQHQPAMDWREVPAFLVQLRADDRVGIITKLAFEWLILTAARTSEVLGARWDEIDRSARTWTIPPERMKARELHIVYLSKAALAILDAIEGFHDKLLFPSPMRHGEAMSNMAFLETLKRLGLNGPSIPRDKHVVPHGFRASFSSWANESGEHAREVIEAALAHREQDVVRAAYNHASYLTQRRKLADEWGKYCIGAGSKKPRKRGERIAV